MRTNQIKVQINFVNKTNYSILDFRKIQLLFTDETCCSSVSIFKTFIYLKRYFYVIEYFRYRKFREFLAALHKKRSFPLRISSVNVTIWSHLLKKSLMKSFIFCAVQIQEFYVRGFLPPQMSCLLNSLKIYWYFIIYQI